ncbi:MAG: hypothetical protein OXF98_10130, partial [Rhodospirillaceae bacterium]|nr:hypothetical protein [Rhodospirillaceae bacterium]
MSIPKRGLALILGLGSSVAAAQDAIDALLDRGAALYHDQVGCWVCHGESGEGLVGPSLRFGPTPVQIQDQLDSNP